MNWLDELEGNWPPTSAEFARLIAIARREERLRAAAEAVTKSGRGLHLYGCAISVSPCPAFLKTKCDCGLDALREALKETQ
jgi:hypothetical protein